MIIKNLIQNFDPENQFEVLINSFKQIDFAWNNKFDLSFFLNKKFNNIILSGLGGSAIAGDLIQNFLRDELNISFQVNRNYYLPNYVNEKSLLIISSYSGNTEETIEVLNQAINKKCLIICVTTGGKILEISKNNNLTSIILEKGFQPRYSLGLSFFTLLKIFQELILISNQNEIVNCIKKSWEEKGIEYSSEKNIALDLAENLLGFIPLIYSAADLTNSVGYRFKCQLNENSKLNAFHNILPELNHNEIVGWEDFREEQFRTKIINILDEDYHPQIKKRFEITSELIKKYNIDAVNISSSKKNFKERLLDLIYLCDWISYYLAIIRRKNPSEIDNINYLKNKLQ